MKLLNFISLMLLLSYPAVDGFTQSTAQARMQVRVEVLSAAGIDAIQPEKISSLKEEISTLAQLRFVGAKPQDLFINISNKLLLKNERGDLIHLTVTDHVSDPDAEAADIELKGQSNKEMHKGIYTGELTATVEYL